MSTECSVGIGVFLLILLVAFGSVGHAQIVQSDKAAAAQVYHKAPVLTHVFSMDTCPPCRKLKLHLVANKVRVHPTLVYNAPEVNGFPSCAYNYDGRILWDNGERIYSGDYRLPEQPVEIIEYITKGRK